MNTQKINDEQGTQRLNDSQGTQRLDDSQGTQRLEDEHGTQRLDDESTQRLDDNNSNETDVQPVQEAFADGKKTGVVFSPGQLIELNGNNYRVDSVISQSSGEGVIYSISSNGKTYVLKYYKLGFKYPENVLAVIKNNPKDKIIKLFEYGSRDGQDFEIMEYAEGGTLDDYLKTNGPVRDTAKLRTIVGQINEGLYHLHTRLKIIYQDLKPENIYFLDKEKTKIVLADFGISNLMDPETNTAQVKANVTKEYAAPELSRTGNEIYALVGPPADYFALGITIYHVWLGFKPFQNISQGERDNQVRENAVALPADMSADFKTIIQGLINSKRNARWGYQQISKWAAGESVTSDYQIINYNYDRAMFNDTESYGSLSELAELLEKYPDKGIHRLYGESIISWLAKSGNTIVDDIKSIITTYPKDRQSGLYKTIYTLDPSRPFISNGGKKCSNTVEIADALISESIYYKTDLKNINARLYQYFEAAEGMSGRIIAEQFHEYFKDYSPERALKLCFLKLQADSGQSIKLGGKVYQNAEDLAAETEQNQRELLERAASEKDSLFNVWLSDHFAAFYESTDGFFNISASNKFFLLGKFSFLSYKKFYKDNWQEYSLIDLTDLIHNNSGRQELFNNYAAQGLPFKGQSQKLNWKPTPVQYLVKFFDSIVPDQDTGFNLLRFLHAKGADLNETSGDGSLPLTTAVYNRNIPLTKLLLELGADPDKKYKYAPIMWALDRKDNKDPEADRITLAKLLIDQKINLNVTKDDYTPLTYTIREFDDPDKINLISRIIKSGGNVNLVNNDGISPLAHAVIKQSQCHNNNQSGEMPAYKAVELLLNNGAKTNTLNKKGYWSPLMHAAEGGLTDTIKLLYKYGANKNYPDANGDTAFIYAKRKNQTSAMDLLKPGLEFKLKTAVFTIVKILLGALSMLWVFFSFDVLSRGISLLNLNFVLLIIASVLLSHILTACIGVVIKGKKYFDNIKSFYSVEKYFLYIILVPVLFPVVIAGLQILAGFLPDNIVIALLSLVNLLSSSGSPLIMILLFFLPLAVLIAARLIYDKLTSNFAKTIKHYKSYYRI